MDPDLSWLYQLILFSKDDVEFVKSYAHSVLIMSNMVYSQTCIKRPLSKRPKIGFQDLSLNADQKYCRTFQGKHSAMLSTFIKLPFVIKIFVLSSFEWPFYTGFTVLFTLMCSFYT